MSSARASGPPRPRCHCRRRSGLDPGRPEFEEEWKREVDHLAVVLHEDEYAWHAVQRGMRSRFAPRGRYAPSEEMLVRLNHWLIGKYQDEDQRA